MEKECVKGESFTATERRVLYRERFSGRETLGERNEKPERAHAEREKREVGEPRGGAASLS